MPIRLRARLRRLDVNVRIPVFVCITCLGSLAYAEAPEGRYQLKRAPNKSSMKVDGKELPSCGSDARKRIDKLGALDITYRGRSVLVNGQEWVFDRNDGLAAVAYGPKPDSRFKIELSFRRMSEEVSVGVVTVYISDAQGVPRCADSQALTGSYQAGSNSP